LSAKSATRLEALKAPRGVGCEEGVSPSPQVEESEEGECPIPRNFFLRFWGKNGVLSWTLGAKFCFFFYDQNSIEIHLEYKDCHGD